MDARSFLEKVIAWPAPGAGYVNLHDHLPGGPFKGVAVETIDAFMRELDKAREKNRNLYVCISQQKEAKPNGVGLAAVRNRLNATFAKAVCIDLDVGEEKGYATREQALEALKAFLGATGLPPPSAIVASGSGGFHVWWASNVPLIPSVWQVYADHLRALFDVHGLRVSDPACTTDIARVFRVPNTLNHKWDPPRKVKLLGLGKEYDFAAIFKVAASAPGETAAPPSPGRLQLPARYKGKPIARLGENIEPPPLAKAADVIPLCPFLLATLRTGGEGRPEPQWREALRCAAAMEDGEKLAHKFSEGDKRYKPGETEKKFQETLDAKEKYGWPTCAKISDTGAPECKTCPHLAKGLSPFKIAREVAKAKPAPIVKTGHWSEALPFGYTFNRKEQLIFAQVLKKKGDHKGDDDDDDDLTRPVVLFKTKIVAPPWVSNSPGDGVGINFKIQRDHETTKDAFIPMSAFPRSRIMATLFEEGLIPNSQLPPTKFEDFMGSYIERMNSYISIKDQQPFGWVDKDGANDEDLPVGFSYGGIMFNNDGTKDPSPLTDTMLRTQYSPCGKEQAWHDAAALILKQNRPELEIILAAAFAGPMVRFTGQPGAMLVVYSNASGAHKSTASRIGAAIWGDPATTREVHGSTWKGSMKRLAATRNLTGVFDDIQDEKDIKALADTGLTLCQGFEGTKLQADRDFHVTGNWRTLIVACLNKSFVGWLAEKTSTPVARLARIFEIEYQKNIGEGIIDQLDADRLVGALERNYGQVGLKYAELLANNAREIRDLVKAEHGAFLKALGPAGTKDNSLTRYWFCACVSVLAGAKLANAMGIELHYDAIKARLVEAFHENLTREKEEAVELGTKENTLAAMSKYFSVVGDANTLWTKISFDGTRNGKGIFEEDVHIIGRPSRGDTIHCQAIVQEREIWLSCSALKRWCFADNANYDALKKGLQDHFGVKGGRLRRTLGAGTNYARMRQDVLAIPVPEGSIFEEFLLAHGGVANEQIR